MVSSHKEVRNALLDNCIFFFLVYPPIDRKKEFIKRYEGRGNNEAFVKLISNNWESWLKEIQSIPFGCEKIEMAFRYLDDEIKHLKTINKG